jgi:hypothetical protein
VCSCSTRDGYFPVFRSNERLFLYGKKARESIYRNSASIPGRFAARTATCHSPARPHQHRHKLVWADLSPGPNGITLAVLHKIFATCEKKEAKTPVHFRIEQLAGDAAGPYPRNQTATAGDGSTEEEPPTFSLVSSVVSVATPVPERDRRGPCAAVLCGNSAT